MTMRAISSVKTGLAVQPHSARNRSMIRVQYGVMVTPMKTGEGQQNDGQHGLIGSKADFAGQVTGRRADVDREIVVRTGANTFGAESAVGVDGQMAGKEMGRTSGGGVTPFGTGDAGAGEAHVMGDGANFRGAEQGIEPLNTPHKADVSTEGPSLKEQSREKNPADKQQSHHGGGLRGAGDVHAQLKPGEQNKEAHSGV